MNEKLNSEICAVALMCHAPIVIPEIGGHRAINCQDTTHAMSQAAESIMRRKPDVLVLLSPHTPRLPHEFSFVGGEHLQGSFKDFGFPNLKTKLPNAPRTAELIRTCCKNEGIDFPRMAPLDLDHGALVPLQFLVNAGWDGPTCVIAFPYQASHEQCRRLGKAIAKAAKQSEESWALIASGDMSHRLIPGAPAGFHPEASKFDAHIVSNMKDKDLNNAVKVDEALRSLAAEDVVDSLEIASAAINFDASKVEVLSYEGPFGVGYLNAIMR